MRHKHSRIGFKVRIIVSVWLLCLTRFSEAQSKPLLQSWGNTTDKSRSDTLLNWLILGCTSDNACSNVVHPKYRHVEYSGYDGFYNNIANPSQGGIDTPLLRILPPVYEDGSYEPAKRKANPLTVSAALMKGENGRTTRSGNTAFLLFFGQQVVEEVLDAQGAACPPEYFNIDIEGSEGHEFKTTPPVLKELPFLRTRYDMRTGYSPNNPRQQLNEITPYIDGGLIYGAAKSWADVLRTDKNNRVVPKGQLASHSELGPGFPAENSQRLPMANPPPPTKHSIFVEREETDNVNRFFKLGNPRGNENPFLLTFGIFWYRWHNKVAEFLSKNYPEWDGERVFNEARKWVIATQQAVTVYDWFPKYLKTPLNPYSYYDSQNQRRIGGYDPTVNPQISHIFQSAAMRFGHTLIPSGVYLRDRNSEGCGTANYKLNLDSDSSDFKGVRTCNSFWRSPELFSQPENFDRFIMGMSSQPTEEEDNIIVEDLRGRVFGPLEFSRRDLMAVNIQRARDHGLPDYNTARKHFGLEPLDNLSVSEFKRKTNTKVKDDVLKRLEEVYGSPDEVDIWPGGLLETRDGPGQLFTAVIKNQFERIRAGDRFWFENINNGLFTNEEIGRIREMKIIDILLSVATNITLMDIQEDPFTGPRPRNFPGGQECQKILTHRTNCTVYSVYGNSSVESLCRFLPPLGNANLEECSKRKTYDYFSGSKASFILTFLFTGIACVAIFVGVNSWTFIKQKKKARALLSTIKVKEGQFKCKEKLSFFDRRVVIVSLEDQPLRIVVNNSVGKVLRAMEIGNLSEITVHHTPKFERILIKAQNHYDLFLHFDNDFYSQQFISRLKTICEGSGVIVHMSERSKAVIRHDIVTVHDREEQLASFMANVLHQDKFGDGQVRASTRLPSLLKSEISSIQLTRTELANALGMTIDSLFFNRFFYLMDTDQNGFITIQEFASVMTKFSKGTVEEKAALFFNIYDLDHSGYLSIEDFRLLVESSQGSELKGQDIESIVNSMLQLVNLQPGDKLSFDNFLQIFQSQAVFGKSMTDFNKTSLGKRDSQFSIYGDVTDDEPEKEKKGNEDFEEFEDVKERHMSPIEEKYSQLAYFVRSKQTIIFMRCLYTIVMFLIFAERAYYYSVEREHSGLRRIAGYGVTVTRGAASAMMFTFSTLLITMCRNILSSLRSSFLHRYFPFDDMIEMHKYIGWWALFWTAVHIIGHAINFYHISTQTASDLSCIFRNFYRSTHVLPKFHYWCWETITGLTGVFLTVQIAVIYIFAVSARRHLFRFFWLTHNTYPLFYLLTILHGSGQLVQPPFFYFFFLGPIILFTLDKLVSVSRSCIQIDVVGAKHLPSSVTLLRIRRPYNFNYLSGQWVRIACLSISNQEFHPFTLSSAPHERDLTLHIRAVGPWTNNLRKVYPDYETIKSDSSFTYPKVFIDGPFGEGHQMWSDHEIAVLVGGGIGVTPFASILKDIVFRCRQPTYSFKCKKIIFLWVTRSQKQFEWLTDILRQVEEADVRGIVRIHIFITQFKSKYDLRTTMLYHAERRFQKLSGKSMFTGLKALTHFSRPNFQKVFKSIKNRYSSVPIIGVFTCGNPSLSSAVEAGCTAVNMGKDPVLKHYYENF